MTKFYLRAEFSRAQSAKKRMLKGRIQVNGKRVKSPYERVDASVDEIIVDGERVTINKFVYIMLNKPQGVVSAGENEKDKTVIDILPESFKRAGLFPAGRLDKDTVGLIIITNDGVSGAQAFNRPKTTPKRSIISKRLTRIPTKKRFC